MMNSELNFEHSTAPSRLARALVSLQLKTSGEDRTYKITVSMNTWPK